MNKEKLDAFLEELTALSRKHCFSISGCGCCCSPVIYEEKIVDAEKCSYSVDYEQKPERFGVFAGNLRFTKE